MEQVVESEMNYQSTSGNQMPKGFKVKHVFQLALVLAVVIWLQYQIKHSNSKGMNYGGSIQKKLSEDQSVVILGRKGNAGWSSDGSVSDLEDVNLVEEDKRKGDGGGGDDEFDGNVEDRFFHKENEYARGRLETREEKENGKEPELEHIMFLKNKDNNSDIGVGGKDESVDLDNHSVQGEYSKKGIDDSWSSVSDHDKQGDEKGREIHEEEEDDKDPKTQVKQVDDEVSERQVKEPQNIEEVTDEAARLNRENEEDKDIAESNQEVAMEPSGMENNATDLGRSEVLDGDSGFPDENGIPLDGSGLSESMFTDSQDDHANIQHQETITNSSYQSTFSKSTIIEGVATQEDMDAADVESRNKAA